MRKRVNAASGLTTDEALAWVMVAESAPATFEGLADSGRLKSIDRKLGLSLVAILHGDFARTVGLLEEEACKQGRSLTGRQLLFLIYAQFSQSSAGVVAFNLEDLLNCKLVGNNLEGFLVNWDSVLANAGDAATEALITALFLKQVESVQDIAPDLIYYNRLAHGHEAKNYAYLRKAIEQVIIVKREVKLRKGALLAMSGTPKSALPAGVADEAAAAKAAKKTAAKLRRAAKKALPAQPAAGDKPYCFKFQLGKCVNDKCTYKHERNAAALERARSPSPAAAERGRPKGKGKGARSRTQIQPQGVAQGRLGLQVLSRSPGCCLPHWQCVRLGLRTANCGSFVLLNLCFASQVRVFQ